jgi:hypothetical protein
MNWAKIQEDVVKIILAMVITAFGGATVWGVTTIIQHERQLILQEAENKMLKEQLSNARSRDEELITMMAEEIKKLQKAVEETCAHVVEEEKPEWPPVAKPQPQPKKDPKEAFNKFFPPEQKTQDYDRILRDKFRERTEQHQIQEQIRE